MKSPAIIAACLLPFVMAGCFHKTRPACQLQPYTAPPSTVPKPDTAAVDLPASVTTIATQPLASDESQLQAPKHPPKRKKPKNPQVAANSAPPNTANAAPAAPESREVSAIGKLSSGGDPSELRQQTADSITATERGLNGINRTLTDPEQKIAAQIREYLKQARDALTTNDVDGAHTLAAKAKVLLSELAG